MKRFIFLLLILCSLSAAAAEYVGTMQLSSGYTLEDVRVALDRQGNLTLYRVKFARLMPVRVDVLIPQVKCRQDNNRTILSGDSIIPLVGDKPHPDRLITDLNGRIEGNTLVFRCTMGSKQLHYSGIASSASDVKKGFSIYGHEVRTNKAKVENWLKAL